MSTFPTRLQYVAADEPLTGAVVNRLAVVLDDRTQYLREAIAAMESHSLLVMENAPLAQETSVGQPVYWNTTTQRFELALATLTVDSETMTVRPSATAEVLGLVLSKESQILGTVALRGIAKFQSLANAIDGTVVPGRYYLSGTTPGKLVRQRPAVPVSVGYIFGAESACSTDILVYIDPQSRPVLEDHTHYQFELAAVPAGDHVPPVPGEAHTITSPDADLRGWLPATHPIFDGKAPEGAKFGYNLSAHPALRDVWPPVPLGACVLEVYRKSAFAPVGEETVQTAGRVVPEFVQFTADGIWWMTDCYDQVPWPTDYVAATASSEAGDACPVIAPMRLLLSFVRMTLATDKSVVTSLHIAEGTPIAVTDAYGDPATSGDLWMKFDTIAAVSSAETYGGEVLKGVNANLIFDRGWVCEGISAGSERIQLTSTRQRRLVPGNPATPLVHQGIITLDIDPTPGERELAPQIIKLGDALERFYRGVMYIGLPAGRDSAVRLMFFVPMANLPPNPVMKIRTLLLPPATGTFPALTMTYARLARPEPEQTVPLLDSDTAVDFETSMGVTANALCEVESASFTIAPGDIVVVSIARSATANPAYPADVGLLRLAGIVISGT